MMLHYCATRKHHHTIDVLKDFARGRLDGLVDVRAYPDLVSGPVQPEDVFILTDLERLPFPSTLGEYWRRVQKRWPGIRSLNHPTRTLARFELLRTLHHHNINRYNVHPATEIHGDLRFPVFVRVRTDHDGAKSPLIETRIELERTVDRLLDSYGLQQLMIVEFCDTSDARGIFRKYAVYRIGNELIPHHVQFAREWMIKRSQLDDEEFVREELDYVKSPLEREAKIRSIFELARIEYGRLDYSLLGGEIQAWEINTNPTVVGRTPLPGPRGQVPEYVVPRIIDSLRRLAGRDAT